MNRLPVPAEAPKDSRSVGSRVRAVAHRVKGLIRGSHPEHGQEEKEFPPPYLKIPNGRPVSDGPEYYDLYKDNEPSREELAEFYRDNPEALDRLVICRNIPIDTTDGWGFFGNEKYGGYLHVVERRYEGKQTVADELVVPTLANNIVTTEYGRQVPVIKKYHEWPLHKYPVQIISPERTPTTYAFVREMLGREVDVPPTDPGRIALEGASIIERPPEERQ